MPLPSTRQLRPCYEDLRVATSIPTPTFMTSRRRLSCGSRLVERAPPRPSTMVLLSLGHPTSASMDLECNPRFTRRLRYLPRLPGRLPILGRSPRQPTIFSSIPSQEPRRPLLPSARMTLPSYQTMRLKRRTQIWTNAPQARNRYTRPCRRPWSEAQPTAPILLNL